MFEQLIRFDKQAFLKLNRDWTSALQDSLIPWLRHAEFWYPFYLFLLAFILFNFRRQSRFLLAAIAVNVTASDMISARLVKSAFQRLRPCNDPEMLGQLILRVPHCSGGYSFVSSHACNHFAIATLLFLVFRPVFGNKMAWIFLWAGMIAYAQVYVGVHFPLDVICGALLGTLIGWLCYRLFYWLAGNQVLSADN